MMKNTPKVLAAIIGIGSQTSVGQNQTADQVEHQIDLSQESLGCPEQSPKSDLGTQAANEFSILTTIKGDSELDHDLVKRGLIQLQEFARLTTTPVPGGTEQLFLRLLSTLPSTEDAPLNPETRALAHIQTALKQLQPDLEFGSPAHCQAVIGELFSEARPFSLGTARLQSRIVGWALAHASQSQVETSALSELIQSLSAATVEPHKPVLNALTPLPLCQDRARTEALSWKDGFSGYEWKVGELQGGICFYPTGCRDFVISAEGVAGEDEARDFVLLTLAGDLTSHRAAALYGLTEELRTQSGAEAHLWQDEVRVYASLLQTVLSSLSGTEPTAPDAAEIVDRTFPTPAF